MVQLIRDRSSPPGLYFSDRHKFKVRSVLDNNFFQFCLPCFLSVSSCIFTALFISPCRLTENGKEILYQSQKQVEEGRDLFHRIGGSSYNRAVESFYFTYNKLYTAQDVTTYNTTVIDETAFIERRIKHINT